MALETFNVLAELSQSMKGESCLPKEPFYTIRKTKLLTLFFSIIIIPLFGQQGPLNPTSMPGIAGTKIVLCELCNNTIQLGNTNNSFCSYLWTATNGDDPDDPTSPNPVVCPTQTTNYMLIVTDEDGNAYYDNVTIQTGATLTSQLYYPKVLGLSNSIIPGSQQDSLGSMTFVNIDNDDMDDSFDDTDNQVNYDNELVEWLLIPSDPGIADVVLRIESGQGTIRVWKDPHKNAEYKFNKSDAFTVYGDNITLNTTGNYTSFYIEGIQAHTSPRQAKLSVSTANGSCQKIISITVVGIKKIEWEGIKNPTFLTLF